MLVANWTALLSSPAGVIDEVMQSVNSTGFDTETGPAQFGVSATGTLVYATGGIVPDLKASLIWLDRRGVVQPVPVPSNAYFGARLAPDARHLVLTVGSAAGIGAWVQDVDRGTLTRLTSDDAGWGVWSPDGSTSRTPRPQC
jgi:hypothetical protein